MIYYELTNEATFVLFKLRCAMCVKLLELNFYWVIFHWTFIDFELVSPSILGDLNDPSQKLVEGLTF